MIEFLDSHQHFWQYSASAYPWIPTGSALHRDWLPNDLAAIQSPLKGQGSIAVQARQSVEESEWLLGLAEQHEVIRGVVGWVDLRSADVEKQLERFSGNSKFVGVRHVVQDEPDDQFLVREEFVRGIGKLAKFGLVYDLLIFPHQLPAAIKLVQMFPEQSFVLDHCAKPQIKNGEMQPWAGLIRDLAKSSNVTCKVSGIVTEADWQSWSLSTLQPYLEVIKESFGPNRLMFGSDWPVCLHASSYERWLNDMRTWVADWSTQEQSAFFAETAKRVYGV